MSKNGGDDDDEEFSFANSLLGSDVAKAVLNPANSTAKGTSSTSAQPSQQPKKPDEKSKAVANLPHDEEVDVSDADESADLNVKLKKDDKKAAPATGSSSAASTSSSSAALGSKSSLAAPSSLGSALGSAAGAGTGPAARPAGDGKEHKKKEFDKGDSDAESEDEAEAHQDTEAAPARPSQAKLYNANEYKHLVVSQEIQDLFDYIGRYKAQDIELDTKLKPFIPDYIPAVGDIDPFLKVPRPDDQKELLGLTELDEPSAHQSDPTVLELTYRIISKKSTFKPVTVGSIEHADKNPKAVTNWITSIEGVHRKKPAPNVVYSRTMPDIEQLMQVWPAEFEQLLGETPLPSADMNMSVEQYARVVCALLDIPVYDKVVESLHVLFTLYSEFKTNAHLNRAE